ncbi:MAG: hypothetical protein WKF28_10070 [Rubrobacteraceae bacterium]|jgi:hypothetical protein
MDYVSQEKLDLIQREARRVQELARELSVTRSASEAQRIRRKMVRLSKDIEEASGAADDRDEAMRAVG